MISIIRRLPSSVVSQSRLLPVLAFRHQNGLLRRGPATSERRTRARYHAERVLRDEIGLVRVEPQGAPQSTARGQL
eukprot:4816978-Prymnesium_polylepis.1